MAIFPLLAMALALSCSDASSDRQAKEVTRDKKVGGCLIDTIAIGTGLERAEAPMKTAARIEVLSIREIGSDRFRSAAVELTSLLDTLGVPVYTRSELIHVRKGPCWPAYRVGLLIDAGTEEHSGRIRDILLKTPLAGASPAAARPGGYGAFFITCGRTDRDWWTVWYADTGGGSGE